MGDISHREILRKLKHGTQIHKVLEYLINGNTLTVMKSLELWGYYYLPVSINRLKKLGAKIVDINVGEGSGRYKKKRIEKWAEYKLEE